MDFVIHSGDLFDNNRPSTEALLAFQKALLRLNEAKIPIYAIAGNHDSILRKGALPPQVLFKDIGLKLISDNHPMYTEGPVLICGVRYVPSSQSRALKSAYDQLSKMADKYLKSILVSHQGIDKWMHEDTHEIELSQMPKNFDYYAMGHVHNYVELVNPIYAVASHSLMSSSPTDPLRISRASAAVTVPSAFTSHWANAAESSAYVSNPTD